MQSELESFQYPGYQDEDVRQNSGQELLDVLSRESQPRIQHFGTDQMKMDQRYFLQLPIEGRVFDQEMVELNSPDENPSHTTSYLSNTQSKNLSFFPPNSNQRSSYTEKGTKKQKKDEMRNLYPNAMKTTIRKICLDTEVYDNKLQKISRKMEQENFGYLSIQQFKEYCKTLKVLDFSLRDIYGLMNFNVGTREEKQKKKMLNEFFVWFLRKRYTIEIIKSEQCEFKEIYLRGKNLLRYLPAVKPKKGKDFKKNTLSQKV